MVNTIINVNGRQYDARTGKMLGKVPDPAKPSPAKPAHKPIHNIRSTKTGAILDGVSKPKPPQQNTIPSQPQSTATPTNSRVTDRATVSRTLDIKAANHKVQHSKTLSRTAVVKPVKASPVIHSTSSIANSKVEKSATGRGLLVKRIPDSRLARASQTVKSSVIQKFNASPLNRPPKLDHTLEVAKPPVVESTTQTATKTRSLHKPKLGNQSKTKQTVFFHPSIENATNHKNPKFPKKKFYTKIAEKIQINPKIVGVGAAAIAILVMGGFFVYQRMPNVALRVASSKAGFHGRMPSTTPAGFAFKGPIKYSKGSISIGYVSRSDDRNFVLSQKPTDQTSESLLVSEISPSKKHYQTYHDRGMTVFIYNDGNAAWIDKGILYNIKDNGALSSEQVLSIAASM